VNGEAVFHFSYLLGPFGGIVALAFGAGSGLGWSFAIRTVFKLTKAQVAELKDENRREREECERRINALEARVKEVEDRYTSGMERQLAQVRESGARIIGRDVSDRKGGM